MPAKPPGLKYTSCPFQVDVRCNGLEALHLGSAVTSTATHDCGAATLKRVVLASNALEAVRWRGFVALESLALACTWLAEVDLSDCDSLGDAALLALGDGAGSMPGSLPRSRCPRLRCAWGFRWLTLHKQTTIYTPMLCKHSSCRFPKHILCRIWEGEEVVLMRGICIK